MFDIPYYKQIEKNDCGPTAVKMIIEYFEFYLKTGNFLCDFFINEDDGQLWVVIKTPWTEYLYDITTHFLVLCCNEEYEWFSLLDWNYIDYFIDHRVASNKTQYESGKQ